MLRFYERFHSLFRYSSWLVAFHFISAFIAVWKILNISVFAVFFFAVAGGFYFFFLVRFNSEIVYTMFDGFLFTILYQFHAIPNGSKRRNITINKAREIFVTKWECNERAEKERKQTTVHNWKSVLEWAPKMVFRTGTIIFCFTNI